MGGSAFGTATAFCAQISELSLSIDELECVVHVTHELRNKGASACSLMDHPLLEPFEVRFFDEQRAILVEVTLRYCRGQTFADAILPVCERAQTAR